MLCLPALPASIASLASLALFAAAAPDPSHDPQQMKEMQEQMQGNDPSALFSQLLSGNMPEPPKPAIKEKKSRK